MSHEKFSIGQRVIWRDANGREYPAIVLSKKEWLPPPWESEISEPMYRLAYGHFARRTYRSYFLAAEHELQTWSDENGRVLQVPRLGLARACAAANDPNFQRFLQAAVGKRGRR